MNDPIDNVVWVPSRKLTANFWNPNVVFGPELRLLERSILEKGWCAAITVNPDLYIIDGFHRWKLSMDSAPIRDKYAEEVPTVTLDVPTPQAMLMTIQMNRARGTHVALRMASLVQSLRDDYGMSREEIMVGIGATKEEVDLLLAGSLLKTRNLAGYKYSSAWVPIETRRTEKSDEFERAED